MFIDTAEPSWPRSGGAKCLGTLGEIGLRFAPLERDLFSEARSINISSLRDEQDCKEK